MDDPLTPEEKDTLRRLARQALERAVQGQEAPAIDLESMTPHLRELGASFVTLTIQGELRGCIGALEPAQPLAADVRDHAAAAALEDPRFMPVRPEADSITLDLAADSAGPGILGCGRPVGSCAPA
jgi:AMMECR1 domain-containing protein